MTELDKNKRSDERPDISFSTGAEKHHTKKEVPPVIPQEDTAVYDEPVGDIAEETAEIVEESAPEEVSETSDDPTVADRLFGFYEPAPAEGDYSPVIPQEDEQAEDELPDYGDGFGGEGAEDITPVIPQEDEQAEDEFPDYGDGFGGEGAEDITPVIPQEDEQAEDEFPDYGDGFGGEESEGSESGDTAEEPAAEAADEGFIPYQRDDSNKGAGFTMRTSDDRDRRKNATAQPEYTRRGEEKRIASRISKLRSGLTMRAAVLLFASVFSLFITVANDLEAPLAAVFDRTVNPSAYLFTNTILGIVAIGFGYSMVTNGIANILKLRPDTDSIVALNLLVAVVSGLITLFNPDTLKAAAFHLYTSVAITGMLFNTLGKLTIVRRAERNFEFVSQADSFCAVQHAEDGAAVAYITGGASGKPKELAFMRRTDFVRDFVKNSYSYDLADLFAEKAGILILFGSAAVGVLSLVFDPNDTDAMGKVFIFLAAMSGTLSLCSSFALSFVANRPLALASRELIENGAVMLGYSSAEEFAEVGSVLFGAEQLYPAECVQFVNLKMLGSTMIDRSIIYAASLAEAGKLFTRPAFERMLGGSMEGLEEVKDCSFEDGTGVSGWIASKRMLLGSREMMKRHNIDGLPSEGSEDSFAAGNRVLYLAISGRAAMMFSVKLVAEKRSAARLRELQAEGVEIHVHCTDGILTREYIAESFGLKTDRVHIVSSQFGQDVEQLCAPAESLSASMFCSGKAGAMAMLITAAKRVKSSANLGIAIQYGELVLGVATAAIMMMAGRFGQISPTVAIVFNLSFLAATLLLQKIRK